MLEERLCDENTTEKTFTFFSALSNGSPGRETVEQRT